MMKTGPIQGRTIKMSTKKIIVMFGMVCSLFNAFGGVNQDIVWRLDRIVRHKDADGAVELLEFIEQQSLLSFGGSRGPIDTNSDLVRTVFFCSGFMAETSLDTRWAKLAKLNPEDTEEMKNLLSSGNAGERALALVKLKSRDRQEDLVDALLQLESKDPVVYVGTRTRDSSFINPQPPRYDFYAPLREKSRDILKAWGSDPLDDSTFLTDVGAFGMERLIRLFAETPSSRNGVLQVLYSLDEKSTGTAYLNALESHELLPAKTLLFLKGHVNKRLRYGGGYMGADGMGLQTVLDGLPDSMDVAPLAPVPGSEKLHDRPEERAEKQVPGKPSAGSSAMATIPGKTSPAESSTNSPAIVAPVQKQRATEKKRNILVLSLGVVVICLVTVLMLLRLKKR